MKQNRDRFATLFLRAVGTAAAMAAFCAVMPFSWMETVHKALGMWALPDKPIVQYLARSTSAFYAIFGGLLLLVSFDLDRYRKVLQYIGVSTIALGILLFVTDWSGGMPTFWWVGEGPIDILIGVVILRVGCRCKEAS